jgi:hypothetical protein
MSRPTRSSMDTWREDLAFAGARSAYLQHLENREGREGPGALRVFAAKRMAFACEVKIGCSLVSAQPTD